MFTTSCSNRSPPPALVSSSNRNAEQSKGRKRSILRRKEDTKEGSHQAQTRSKMAASQVSLWSESFERLLDDPVGIHAFSVSDPFKCFESVLTVVLQEFLKKEYSEENIRFWLECEQYKSISARDELRLRAEEIYTNYMSSDAPQAVNIDSSARQAAERSMTTELSTETFIVAQTQIFNLMKMDSYRRFLKSDEYKEWLAREKRGDSLQDYIGRKNQGGDGDRTPPHKEKRRSLGSSFWSQIASKTRNPTGKTSTAGGTTGTSAAGGSGGAGGGGGAQGSSVSSRGAGGVYPGPHQHPHQHQAKMLKLKAIEERFEDEAKLQVVFDHMLRNQQQNSAYHLVVNTRRQPLQASRVWNINQSSTTPSSGTHPNSLPPSLPARTCDWPPAPPRPPPRPPTKPPPSSSSTSSSATSIASHSSGTFSTTNMVTVTSSSSSTTSSTSQPAPHPPPRPALPPPRLPPRSRFKIIRHAANTRVLHV